MTTKPSKPLRVIFLIDNLTVREWQYQLYQYVEKHSDFTIAALVINNNYKPAQSAFFYRLLRKIDLFFFKFPINPFQKKELNGAGELRIKITPKRKKFSDYFSDEDIKKITDLTPDVIIRFGFRILRGKILTTAKYGIWSLHHADYRVNRGGPPGFWEVVNREPTTGITLQVLTEELDAGKIIDSAILKTDYTSFHKNQAAIYWSGVELFKKNLNLLAKGELLRQDDAKDLLFYGKRLYKDPSNIESIKIGLQFLSKTFVRKLTDAFYFQQWVIAFSFNKNIETAFYKYKLLVPPKNTIWADPFIANETGDTFLFAEEKIGKQNGTIICIKFNKEEKHFEIPVTVLKEDFHLSYPFVFKHNEKWYMIPETATIRKVILYEAKTFPYKWKKVKTMIEDQQLYDATLYLHNNVWYMFASAKPSPGISANELLHIYYTDNPVEGTWKLHRKNPIVHTVLGSRPAGAIFSRNGKLIRPSQIGAPNYGYGIQFHEIIKLTTEEYEERPIASIKPEWDKNISAMHTFNVNGKLSVVDFQRKALKF